MRDTKQTVFILSQFLCSSLDNDCFIKRIPFLHWEKANKSLKLPAKRKRAELGKSGRILLRPRLIENLKLPWYLAEYLLKFSLLRTSNSLNSFTFSSIIRDSLRVQFAFSFRFYCNELRKSWLLPFIFSVCTVLNKKIHKFCTKYV